MIHYLQKKNFLRDIITSEKSSDITNHLLEKSIRLYPQTDVCMLRVRDLVSPQI